MIYSAADLHLCRYIWADRKDLAGDSVSAFTDIADHIVQDNLPDGEEKHLILAGDIFDKNKLDGFTSKHFSNIMHYLHTNNVRVYYIQGNHDRSDIPLPEAIQVGYDPIPVHMDGKGIMDIDGKKIVGIDWGPREEMLEKMNAITDPVDYLIIHCAFRHLLGFENAYALSMEDVPANYKDVFVGDIHIRDESFGLPSGGQVISPGSIHACKIDETDAKGFYKLGKEPEFVTIESRPIQRFRIGDPISLDKMTTNIMGAQLGKYEMLVDIQYTPDMHEDVMATVKKFNHNKYFLKRIKKETMYCPQDVVYERATLISALPAILAEKNADYTFMEELLTGNAEQLIETELEKVL